MAVIVSYYKTENLKILSTAGENRNKVFSIAIKDSNVNLKKEKQRFSTVFLR